jgi:N-acetylmuramoyl-L-alanine amidase CwlA
MAFLTPDKVRVEHGLEIKEKIIPWGAKWTKKYGKYKVGDKFKADKLLSNGTGKVEYVTIHNTGDIAEAKGTNDAEQYTRATYPNQNMGDVRVHYFIDETDCWQNLREDEVGWHAGDGQGDGNQKSLSIEIIMSGKGDKADVDAENRGALLAAILLNRHGLGIDRLVTHNKWGGKPDKIVNDGRKNCPVYILPHWAQFKAKVEENLKKIQGDQTKTDKLYRVQVGAFSNRKYAESMLKDLKVDGYNGFIVEEDITPSETVKTFSVGDRARLQDDAVVYGTNTPFKSFVYGVEVYIRELKGDRAVISIQPTGDITGAVDVKYLKPII